MKRFSFTAVTVLALSLGFVPAALGAQSGQLYAFGSNDRGQLGTTINIGTFNPVPTAVSLPGATGPVTQAAAGIDNTLALTSTGQLYAFGDNYYGQLGSTANNKNFIGNPIPAQVSLPGASGPVTQVAAGSAHTLAVTSTGQLYAFGSNRFGQLGNATNSGTEEPSPKPALVSLPGASGPVIQVAAGWGQSLALTSTGQLYAWGRNTNGELGNATDNESETPNPKPALVSMPDASGPVTEIAAGYEHTLALTSTGQLFSFGRNRTGQLGRTENIETGEPNPVPTLVPLTIPAGMSVVDVAKGSSADQTLVALVGPGPPGPAPTASRSRARAATRALVKNGKAMVALSCPGPTSCSGELVIKAKLTANRKRHPAGASAKSKRSVPVKIGSTSFSIRPGKKRTIAVPLKPKALARIKAAGQAGLRAQLSGDGVEAGKILLKPAPRSVKLHVSR